MLEFVLGKYVSKVLGVLFCEKSECFQIEHLLFHIIEDSIFIPCIDFLHMFVPFIYMYIFLTCGGCSCAHFFIHNVMRLSLFLSIILGELREELDKEFTHVFIVLAGGSIAL